MGLLVVICITSVLCTRALDLRGIRSGADHGIEGDYVDAMPGAKDDESSDSEDQEDEGLQGQSGAGAGVPGDAGYMDKHFNEADVNEEEDAFEASEPTKRPSAKKMLVRAARLKGADEWLDAEPGLRERPPPGEDYSTDGADEDDRDVPRLDQITDPTTPSGASSRHAHLLQDQTLLQLGGSNPDPTSPADEEDDQDSDNEHLNEPSWDLDTIGKEGGGYQQDGMPLTDDDAHGPMNGADGARGDGGHNHGPAGPSPSAAQSKHGGADGSGNAGGRERGAMAGQEHPADSAEPREDAMDDVFAAIPSSMQHVDVDDGGAIRAHTVRDAPLVPRSKPRGPAPGAHDHLVHDMNLLDLGLTETPDDDDDDGDGDGGGGRASSVPSKINLPMKPDDPNIVADGMDSLQVETDNKSEEDEAKDDDDDHGGSDRHDHRHHHGQHHKHQDEMNSELRNGDLQSIIVPHHDEHRHHYADGDEGELPSMDGFMPRMGTGASRPSAPDYASPGGSFSSRYPTSAGSADGDGGRGTAWSSEGEMPRDSDGTGREREYLEPTVHHHHTYTHANSVIHSTVKKAPSHHSPPAPHHSTHNHATTHSHNHGHYDGRSHGHTRPTAADTTGGGAEEGAGGGGGAGIANLIQGMMSSTAGAGGQAGMNLKAPGTATPFSLFWPSLLQPWLKELSKLDGMAYPDIWSPQLGGKAPPEERAYSTAAPPVAKWNPVLPPPGPLFPMPRRTLPPEMMPTATDPRYDYFNQMAPKEGDVYLPPKSSQFSPSVMGKSNSNHDFPRSAVAPGSGAQPSFGDRGDPLPHQENPAAINFPYPGVY